MPVLSGWTGHTSPFDFVPLVLAQAEDAPPVIPGVAPAPGAPTAAPAGPQMGAGNGTTGDAGGTTSTGAPGTAPPRQPSMMETMTLPIYALLAVAAMYLLIIRPQKMERKRAEALASAVKKGDKVVTTSGIEGTIAEVRDNHFIIKVDENSNTRMKFLKAAVQRVIEKSDKPEKDEKDDKNEKEDKAA